MEKDNPQDFQGDMKAFLEFIGSIMAQCAPAGQGAGDGPEPEIDLEAARRAHEEAHREMIRRWESSEEDLTAVYGPEVAAILIEWSRMSAVLCRHGQPALSSILKLTGDLVVATEGDAEVLDAVVEVLRSAMTQVKLRGMLAAFKDRAEAAAARRKEARKRRTECN